MTSIERIQLFIEENTYIKFCKIKEKKELNCYNDF